MTIYVLVSMPDSWHGVIAIINRKYSHGYNHNYVIVIEYIWGNCNHVHCLCRCNKWLLLQLIINNIWIQQYYKYKYAVLYWSNNISLAVNILGIICSLAICDTKIKASLTGIIS